MRRTFLLLMTIGCLLAGVVTVRAEDASPKMTGQVVDAGGHPVSNAEVSNDWFAGVSDSGSKVGTMPSSPGVKTDSAGRFPITPGSGKNKTLLMAFDKERKRGGIATVDPGSANRVVTIKLQPLVNVKGKFACKELEHGVGWTNIIISRFGENINFLQCRPDKAAFAFQLPPGRYNLWSYGTNVLSTSQKFTLPPTPLVDLKTLELPAKGYAKQMGKTPPAWNVTEARGVPQNVQLADFKGKWVLIEFWGFW